MNLYPLVPLLDSVTLEKNLDYILFGGVIFFLLSLPQKMLCNPQVFCPSNQVKQRIKIITALMEPIIGTCLKDGRPTETPDKSLVRASFQIEGEKVQHSFLSGDE